MELLTTRKALSRTLELVLYVSSGLSLWMILGSDWSRMVRFGVCQGIVWSLLLLSAFHYLFFTRPGSVVDSEGVYNTPKTAFGITRGLFNPGSLYIAVMMIWVFSTSFDTRWAVFLNSAWVSFFKLSFDFVIPSPNTGRTTTTHRRISYPAVVMGVLDCDIQ